MKVNLHDCYDMEVISFVKETKGKAYPILERFKSLRQNILISQEEGTVNLTAVTFNVVLRNKGLDI